MPPSKVRIVPVAKRLSSLARNKMPAAISSAVPSRPSSCRAANALRVASRSVLFARMSLIRRVDRSRRDRVAAYAVADVIDSDGPRERGHCAFRGAIRRAIGDADGGHYRGGVDDGATAVLFHDGNGVFAAKEHAPHIGCHERVPGFLWRLYNGPGDAVARMVDEDVEAAEAPDGCRDDALNIAGASDVSLDCDRLRALACAFGGHRARVALVSDDEPRSLIGEQQRSRAPDPRAAARDDADFVLKAHRLIFGGVPDPAEYVARNRYPHAALIQYLDVGARLSLLRVDPGDCVGERDRVADEDWREEAHAIVAERYRRCIQRGALAFVDHHRRAGRHIADDQRTMGNTPAEFGARHVLLVDVVHREVSGDPGKEVDVGVAARLGENDAIANVDKEVLHGASNLCVIPGEYKVNVRPAALALLDAHYAVAGKRRNFGSVEPQLGEHVFGLRAERLRRQANRRCLAVLPHWMIDQRKR